MGSLGFLTPFQFKNYKEDIARVLRGEYAQCVPYFFDQMLRLLFLLLVFVRLLFEGGIYFLEVLMTAG